MIKGDGENLLGEDDFTVCRFREGVLVGVRNGEADTMVLFVRFRVGRGGVFIDGYWLTRPRSTMMTEV